MSEDSKTLKKLDRILDAGILLVAVLVGFYLGRSAQSTAQDARPVFSASPMRLAQTKPIGRRISLTGVNWAQNQRSLVLALQSDCRYCLESKNFYRRLVQDRARYGNTRLIAVLPQSEQDSRKFLDEIGVKVDDIYQGTLTESGVRGTPTLLLVNSSGIVTEAWSGKLDAVSEEAVLTRLRIR